MTEKVVSFPGCVAPGGVNNDVVEILEHMLEDAKAGRLTAFIGAGFMHDGSTRSAWANGNYTVSGMIGLTELTKLELIRSLDTA